MNYFATKDTTRQIARAAKLRDWSIIDAILEEQRVCGNLSVTKGFRDARQELGQDPRPINQLDTPEPVTIHDLPSLEGIEITGMHEGEARRWRRKGEGDPVAKPSRRKKRAA